ncbi:MAG TPA: extracellular solute-binding protein [Spirochaetia bacterium]|nr:extracellular solute-binding protein [Spirochaetia bacterium]
MRKFVVSSFLVIIFGFSLPAEQIKFLYMKQSGYDLGDIVERAESFGLETGIRVSPVFVEYEDRYNLILESAAKTIPDLDLILVDLIWVADFAEKGIIDALPQRLDSRVRSGIVPQIYSAFSWRDRLWAIPFHIDFQMLYTNMEDMKRIGASSPPRTLEELVRLARKAKAAGVVKYPFFDSWRQQEVLTCEFTWLVGAFGGSLVDRSGKIDCDSPAARRALAFMVELLNDGLMSPYSLQSEENFVSEVFLAGDCMFTTNWGFMIRLLSKNDQPGVTDWKVSPIPVSETVSRDGKGTSSICGFEGLTVLKGSAHREAAWKFATYLASPEFQGRHLEFMPVWKEVWDREEVRKEDPFLSIKQRQIAGLQYRPVHPRYREISAILQHWIAQALHGQISPAEALREAQVQVDRVTGGLP